MADHAEHLPPMPFRVYALEGRADTTDSALVRHDTLLGEQGKAIDDHRALLAVHTEQILTTVKATDRLTGLMTKVMWTMISFAFAVTVSAVGVALTIVLTGKP